MEVLGYVDLLRKLGADDAAAGPGFGGAGFAGCGAGSGVDSVGCAVGAGWLGGVDPAVVSGLVAGAVGGDGVGGAGMKESNPGSGVGKLFEAGMRRGGSSRRQSVLGQRLARFLGRLAPVQEWPVREAGQDEEFAMVQEIDEPSLWQRVVRWLRGW